MAERDLWRVVLATRCSGREMMYVPSIHNPLATDGHFGPSQPQRCPEIQSYHVPGWEENRKYLANSTDDASVCRWGTNFSERNPRKGLRLDLGASAGIGQTEAFPRCALKGSLLVTPSPLGSVHPLLTHAAVQEQVSLSPLCQAQAIPCLCPYMVPFPHPALWSRGRMPRHQVTHTHTHTISCFKAWPDPWDPQDSPQPTSQRWVYL